jgi:four helix bundle protein
MELETQIQIALRLDYATEVDVTRLLAKTDHVGKMLSALKNSLNK